MLAALTFLYFFNLIYFSSVPKVNEECQTMQVVISNPILSCPCIPPLMLLKPCWFPITRQQIALKWVDAILPFQPDLISTKIRSDSIWCILHVKPEEQLEWL